MKDFLAFFLLQGLNFVVVTANWRAIASERYVETALTDGIFCALSWTIMRKISTAENWTGKAGYVLGGMVGSILAIWLTKEWT